MIPEDLKRPAKGGRPSGHSLLLSLQEYEWLQRKIGRKALLVPKAVNSSPKLKRIVLDLDSKLGEAQEMTGKLEVPLKLNRQELEVIIELASRESLALAAAIGAMSTRKIDTPRYDEAVKTDEVLVGLLKKANSVLSSRKVK